MARIDIGATEDLSSTAQSFQHKIVRASSGKLLIVVRREVGAVLYVSYKTSDDGVTWSGWTDIETGGETWLEDTDMYIDDSDHVYLVYGGTSRNFRKFTYDAGTDSWSLGAKVALGVSSIYDNPSITMRSNGDIWIAAHLSSTRHYFKYWISTNGGTSFSSAVTGPTVGDDCREVCLIPHGSNIWAIVKAAGLEIYEYSSSWDGGVTIEASSINALGVVKVSDDDVWIATRLSGIKVYHWNGSVWDAGTQISDSPSDLSPSLTEADGKPAIVWSESLDVGATRNIVYKKYSNSAWGSKIYLTNDAPKDWYVSTVASDPYKISALWTRGSSSPYELSYEEVEVVTFINISESFKIEDPLEVCNKIELVEVDDSLKLGELIQKNIYLEDFIGRMSEEWRTEIYMDEAIRHYRDYMQVYNPQNLNPPYHYETWYIEHITTGTTIKRVLPAYYIGIIDNVVVHCKDKGSAGTTKVNVKLNGDSIFYQDSDKPSLSFDSSKDHAFSAKPYLDLLGKGDELKLDIESVATGASGLTVNVAVSQASIPISIMRVDAIDENGFAYTGNGILNSDSVYFDIYLTSSVLFAPTIRIIDGDGQTTNIEIDTVSTTNIQNDTVKTKSIDTSEYVGDYTLVITNALSYSGIRQDPFEKVYSFTDVDLDSYLEYSRYSSVGEVAITITNDLFESSISDFSYSLNDVDWTEDVAIANPFTVDITNASVGGTDTEEDKTIYIRFKSKEGSGYLTANIVIGYHHSSFTFEASYYQHTLDTYIIDFVLPTTSYTVPPKHLEVYNGESLIESRTFENSSLSDFSMTITKNLGPPVTHEVDVDSGYIVGSKGAEVYSIPAFNTIIDAPPYTGEAVGELWLVMIEFDTSVIVCEKVQIESAQTSTALLSEAFVPINYESFLSYANDYKSNYIVLYGIHVAGSATATYTYPSTPTQLFVKVVGTSLDLSLKLIDQAGRDYTKDMLDLHKWSPLRIRAYTAVDPNNSDRGQDELDNAAIVDTLPDSYYVEGEEV